MRIQLLVYICHASAPLFLDCQLQWLKNSIGFNVIIWNNRLNDAFILNCSRFFLFFFFNIKNTFYKMRICLVFNLYAISDNCCNVNLRHEVTTCKIAWIYQMHVHCLFVCVCAMYKYRNVRRDVRTLEVVWTMCCFTAIINI